ncbi:MAG: hypothetical protein DWC04_04550 [Candidatus Poseidoniales archaeon]|nr:MAG: hypothetical protein DWC04_04550 [Candidatus Poseidoniales archaeon]
MFECTICGLLSLGGNACPACGSQIRVDLTEQDEGGAPLPADVPGLDEAVASWNELEGIEPVEDVPTTEEPPKASSTGSLPFGYSGASNTHISRLPFGIGSYASGVPFDDSEEALPLVSEGPNSVAKPLQDHTQPSQPQQELKQSDPIPLSVEQATPIPTQAPAPEVPAMPDPPIPRLEPVQEAPALPRLEAAPSAPLPRLEAQIQHTEDNPKGSLVDEPQPPSTEQMPADVPDLWRIDAAAPDMEEIYAQSEQVVEVVHTMEAEPMVFVHESTTEDFGEGNGVISLDIHPAQALDVNLDGLPELKATLQQGFEALGSASWAQAAIAFQKLASRMPGDASVFNNYGLSLLQRALVMAKSPDLDVQNLATTQFESSILALREAAKTAPTEAIILMNLAHALLVSGRAEKAVGLVQMHDQLQGQTTVSGNLHAAALVSMGESSAAKALLQRLPQDEIVLANLDRLSY